MSENNKMASQAHSCCGGKGHGKAHASTQASGGCCGGKGHAKTEGVTAETAHKAGGCCGGKGHGQAKENRGCCSGN